jgi:hypothetical protein
MIVPLYLDGLLAIGFTSLAFCLHICGEVIGAETSGSEY